MQKRDDDIEPIKKSIIQMNRNEAKISFGENLLKLLTSSPFS